MLNFTLRLMILADLVAVAYVENVCHEFPRVRDEVEQRWRNPRVQAIVADADGAILGFVMWERIKALVIIDRAAVLPAHRRQKVGTAMLERVARKCRKCRYHCVVSEANLDAQLFLKVRGFRCVRVLRGWCARTGDSGYLMQRGP